MQDDLGLTYTQAGSLAAAALLVYALMQVPAGVLADRFGAHRLFAVGTLATHGLFLLFATSGSYVVAVVLQALSGLARALAFTPGMVLTTSWFPAERRATAMGLFIAAGSVWTVVFAILAPAFLDRADWRIVVGGWATLGLAVAVVFARIGRPGRVPAGSAATVAPTGLRTLVRDRVMWLACAIQAVRLAIVQGVGLWLPTLLVDERDLPLAVAGGVVAGMAVATAPANILGGWLADRSGRPAIVIGGSLGALAAALLALGGTSSVAAVVVAVAVIAVCQQLYFGPLFALPVAVFGQASAGAVSGVGNLFANLGAFGAVLGLGAIKDATGSLGSGFLVLAVLALVAVLATVALARDVRVGGVRRDRAVR